MSSQDELRIPGIDAEGALKRLGGKRERYESILRKFAGRQSETIPLIRAMLAEGDTVTAEREAHSLKGSAATLGADGLAAAAANLETAIKGGGIGESELAALDDELGRVVAAIRAALPD